MIKYYHLRYRWDDLVSDQNLLGTSGQGGVTIGIRNGHGPGEVEFSHAICCLRDNFCRRTGRQIVNGRFNSGDYRVFTFSEKLSEEARVNTIMEFVKEKAIAKITADPELVDTYHEALV